MGTYVSRSAQPFRTFVKWNVLNPQTMKMIVKRSGVMTNATLMVANRYAHEASVKMVKAIF